MELNEIMDQYWADVVDHIHAAGLASSPTVAPSGFERRLTLVSTYKNLPAFDQVDVLIVHKGRLSELAGPFLAKAITAFAIVFANEVFVVLARGQPAISPDAEHLADWDVVLAQADDGEDSPASSSQLQMQRSNRMPATYLGGGRVLLETAFGHLMLASGMDTSITPHLIRDGWFDYGLTSLLNRSLRPGMTYVDVGANLGTYALIAAAIVGDTGRVIALEPVPRIAGLLNETITMNGFADRCQVLREAAGAVSGLVTIFEFATRQGSNTMLPHIAEEAKRSYGESIASYEVPCRPLDLIVTETDLKQVDFIKIDVEGFEQNVLEGSRNIIMTMRPTLILEWHRSFFNYESNDQRALYHLLTDEFRYALHRVEADGEVNPIDFDDLMRLPHSDILAKPLA